MIFILDILPWVAMILFVVMARSCRATGIIMALHFGVNIFFYKDLQALAVNGENLSGSFIVTSINAITAMVLLTANRWFKETQIIKQTLILLGFIIIDMALTVSFAFSGNPLMDLYYNHYEYVAAALYLIIFWTIWRDMADGLRIIRSDIYRRFANSRHILRRDKPGHMG